MMVQDILRSIIRLSGKKQQEIADELGKSSQGTISMMLQNRNMKIENIMQLLNVCGYELVARSRDGVRPEFVFGNYSGGALDSASSDMKLREMIRVLVSEELDRRDRQTVDWPRIDIPDDDL